MKFKYSKNVVNSVYPKLGEEPVEKKIKNIWVFPDIAANFPKICDGDIELINPHNYLQ